MSKNLVFTAEQLEMLKMTAEDLSLYVAISLYKEKKIDLGQAVAITGLDEKKLQKKIDESEKPKKYFAVEDFSWLESQKEFKKYENVMLSEAVIQERREGL